MTVDLLPFLLGSAGLGGVFGVFSTGQESARAQAQLRQQQKIAWQDYLLGQEHSQAQFNLQRREAAGQLGIAQRRLDQGAAQSLARMNAELLGQAYQAQDAQIQAATAIGASAAAEAAGGTRGGSGGALTRDYQRQSLSRSLGLQQRQNALGLAGMAEELNNARQDLGRERASWRPGGARYESYQAESAYNEARALLGQQDLQWRIDQAAAEPLDYLMGAFSGAFNAMSVGATFYGWSQTQTDGAQTDGFAGVGGQVAKDRKYAAEWGKNYDKQYAAAMKNLK
jgi:hypothetical protein